MANEQHTVRSVSWNEVFSFTHVFKSFKMAIHPSKILLAFLAILLTYTWGRVLEVIWTGASDTNWVQQDEAWDYWMAESRAAFLKSRENLLEVRLTRMQAHGRGIRGLEVDDLKELDEADFSKAYAMLEEFSERAYERLVKEAGDEEIKRVKAIKDNTGLNPEQREEKIEAAKEDRLAAEREALRKTYAGGMQRVRQFRGKRIFAALLDWQTNCIANAVGAVRRGNIIGGLGKLYQQRGSMTPAAYAAPAVTHRTAVQASTDVADEEGYGLLAWLGMMAWGLWWLVSVYPIFALLFLVPALAIWALFGGAVCRMSALHAAREEKISVMAAIRFAISKFLSFLSAPLLPLAMIVLLGLFIALGGFIGWIPCFGEWFVAVLFGLALVLAGVIAFLVIGLLAGWPLMWPTIAVEGSDSFDAISRSFSYVWARPFRYGLYWLVATVYGTVCYLFVRLFAFIVLRATHCWAGWAMKLADKPQYAVGAGKLDVMWARPTFEVFHGPMQWEAMGTSESAAAVVLAAWVYVVSAVVLAFLATFFFSAATNIYYLLRQKVDATDLDDVYVEEAEEEEELPPAEEEAPEPEPEEKPEAEEGEEQQQQ